MTTIGAGRLGAAVGSLIILLSGSASAAYSAYTQASFANPFSVKTADAFQATFMECNSLTLTSCTPIVDGSATATSQTGYLHPSGTGLYIFKFNPTLRLTGTAVKLSYNPKPGNNTPCFSSGTWTQGTTLAKSGPPTMGLSPCPGAATAAFDVAPTFKTSSLALPSPALPQDSTAYAYVYVEFGSCVENVTKPDPAEATYYHNCNPGSVTAEFANPVYSYTVKFDATFSDETPCWRQIVWMTTDNPSVPVPGTNEDESVPQCK